MDICHAIVAKEVLLNVEVGGIWNYYCVWKWDFFIDIILPTSLWSWDRISL